MLYRKYGKYENTFLKPTPHVFKKTVCFASRHVGCGADLDPIPVTRSSPKLPRDPHRDLHQGPRAEMLFLCVIVAIFLAQYVRVQFEYFKLKTRCIVQVD